MRKYDYSIEEMLQIIDEFNDREKIIKDCNKIEEMIQIINDVINRAKKVYEYKKILEMLQNIIEFNVHAIIIAEYKEVEGIEIITEEEMTNLFGTKFFDSNIYDNVHYFCRYDAYMYISDYDQYQIDNGYDPFLADFIDNLEESYVVPWIDLYESLDNLEDVSDMD